MKVNKRIYLISGLSDIEVVGNQSLKNTIKYLSEFGYEIWVFTFIPRDYPNLQDPNKIFNCNNVKFYRLPNVLSFILNFMKKIKNFIGKRRVKLNQSNNVRSYKTMGTYLREYNPLGRLFYLVFLFFFYLPIELLRVLSYSLKYKPVLIYGINCQGALIASILGQLLNKPIITRFHGVSISEYDLANLKNKIFVIDEITGLKAKTDALVMTNDGSKGNRILKLLNVHKDKIYFWMNGFDKNDLILPDNWKAADFRKKLKIEHKKVILMVSRLATWKRIDRGIYCIYSLVKEHKLTDMVLLIIGEGSERKVLQKLAQDLGIMKYIRFCGGIPHKELSKYYTISDIFLTLYEVSNLGNPLLEAMYFGLPIITIADGSTENLLRNGYNSLLIKVENIQNELPMKVIKILKNDSLRMIISQNAKETFKRKILSWEERMRLEENLIKDILRNKRQK